jgi:hypothetical protein
MTALHTGGERNQVWPKGMDYQQKLWGTEAEIRSTRLPSSSHPPIYARRTQKKKKKNLRPVMLDME